jgi:hypothetical protein
VELDRIGAPLLLDHAATLAAVLGFFWLIVATGSELVRLVQVRGVRSGAELAFAVTLGSGAISTTVLAVCAVFGVHLPVLTIVLALLGIVSARSFLPALSLARVAVLDVVQAHAGGWPRNCAVIGMGLVALVLLMLGLAPGADWDSIAYHLAVPSAWLESGRIHVPVDNYHTAFVGLNHVLYLPLLAVGAASGPSLLNACFVIVAALLVAAVTSDTLHTAAGPYSFWLFWASPILVLVGASPRVDVTVALFLLSAHYALIMAVQAPTRSGLLVLSGALLGMAFGVKYHAAVYALCLLPIMLLVGLRPPRQHMKALIRTGAMLGAAALVTSAAWSLKNELLFNAPLFPFLTPTRVEPWLAPFHGPGLAPVGVPPEAYDLLRHIRAPFNVVDLVLRPERLAPDADAAGSRPNLAFLLIPLALAAVPLRRAIMWAGPAACYVAVLLIVSPYTSLRYLVPAVLPFTIIAGSAFHYASARVGRFGRIFIVVAALGAAAPALAAVRKRVIESRPDLVSLGLTSRRTYLHRYWETGAHIQAVEWLNTHLDSNDTVLMLFEARGYFLQIPHRSDMLSRNWAYVNTRAGRRQCLREASITHVLINDHALNFFARRGADLGGIAWEEFQDFSGQCLSLIYQGDGFRVYKIRGQA